MTAAKAANAMDISNAELPASGVGGVWSANVVPVTITTANIKRPIDHFGLFISVLCLMFITVSLNCYAAKKLTDAAGAFVDAGVVGAGVVGAGGA